jgi:nucleotide-binding universal stress UspA family protein
MANFQRILHPIDFSQPAAQAFVVARALARDHGAQMILLHVAERPVTNIGGMPVPSPSPPIEWETLKAQLDAIVKANPDLRIECRCTEGAPASAILDTAKETRCDVIVMGTHGRKGMNRLLMGSVAEQVVRSATCPVLTVKNPASVAP